MFGFLRLRFRVKVLLLGLAIFSVQATLQRLGVGEPWFTIIIAALSASAFLYLVSRFW
jgi:predicted cation transporter